ncbi:MAG: SH3 domain-containing protein [Acidimicrobiia bacterium]|nr:SH3 domain-containing protein [Acidimicrobiia bacterium]
MAIAEAYVGGISLNLRKDLAPRAEVTATVKHGEKLEILAYRRRFAKVRTQSGAEGWTDGRQLLTPEQMARLRRSAERAATVGSQGKMTPFDLLNVHIEAQRQSPTFYQLQEGESADLIGHRVTPRHAPPAGTPLPPDAPMDSWSLVRLKDGRPGWVLSRMMMMAIPDEVGQYAEGHHITAYFPLGSVEDQGQTRQHWLWTTIQSRINPYHFDSFRVFVWSTRRHRYETAYIERNLKGYYPIEVHPMLEGATMPRFSLIFSARDGVLYRRTYEFQGYHVRQIEKTAWQLPREEEEDSTPAAPAPPPPKDSSGGLLARVKDKLKDLFNR